MENLFKFYAFHKYNHLAPIIFLFVFLILYAIFYFFNVYYSKISVSVDTGSNTSSKTTITSLSNSTQSTTTTISKTNVDDVTLFTLVTNFENINPVVNLENDNLKIYTLNSYNISDFCKYFVISNCKTTITISNVSSEQELFEMLKTEHGSFGILQMEDNDFRLRAVNIANQNIFDKSFDIKKYPLKISKTISLDNSDSKSINSINDKYSIVNFTKIGHTGSFLTGRGVILNTNKLHEGDYSKMVEPMIPLFSKFDIMSATQETSLKGDGVYCFDCLSFVGSEKVMDQMVVPLGIDIATMAANHVLDGGVEDLTNTLRLYKEKNIPVVGASDIDNEHAIKPVLVDKGGLKIAYLAINDTPGREEWADDTHPGAASASDWIIQNGVTVSYAPNLDRIHKMVQAAKDLKPDFIILLPHWGSVEYENVPTNYVQNLAHIFLDEGVDIIIGDHPHWVQKMEWYNRKSPSYSGMMTSPIFYSVGNFVFDQMWSIETRQGITVELNFDNKNKKLLNIDLHPHQLYLYDRGTVEPLPTNSPEYRQTLERVYSVSDL